MKRQQSPFTARQLLGQVPTPAHRHHRQADYAMTIMTNTIHRPQSTTLWLGEEKKDKPDSS
jgi:hypothetical protein